jgi:hypothetical protein
MGKYIESKVFHRHRGYYQLRFITMGNSTRQDKRSKGQRRWGLDNEFPLRDSNGSIVIADRRRLTDRRLCNTSFEERLLMFSGLPQQDPD